MESSISLNRVKRQFLTFYETINFGITLFI